MNRPAFAIAFLGLLGLIAAAAIGLLVNEVSGDSIGLAAEPLSASSLAPPEASQDAARRRQERADKMRERAQERRQRQRERRQEQVPQAPATTPTAPVDDNGGDDGIEVESPNSGSGSDDSGSGSDSSGSGSGEFEDD
jgi:hypothetical protein